MRKSSGLVAALLLALLALPTLPPAFAQTTTVPAEGSTTVAQTPPASVPEPAVAVEPAEDEEPLPDWTYRFLIPTGLVVGLIVIVATVVQYFLRVVRTRYRVVK